LGCVANFDVEEKTMDGLKEAVKHLKLFDPNTVVEQGRRAYRMGIEKRANPLNPPSHRVLWERGYDLELERFNGMLQRWKTQ
jgi:hypothetical protein